MTLSAFVLPHVTAGVFALILFWLAALNRKGTLFHRRVGQCYLLAMALIVLTGIPLTIKALINGHFISALFLGYLLTLVSHSCISSVRSIRHRKHRAIYLGRFHQISTGLLGLAGLAVMWFGWSTSMALILVPFGAIGVAAVIGLIRDIQQASVPQNWWLKAHYGAMIGNGVATHIAFSQIGLARLLPGQSWTATLGWLLPLIIGIAAARLLDRRYARSTATIPGRPQNPTIRLDEPNHPLQLPRS